MTKKTASSSSSYYPVQIIAFGREVLLGQWGAYCSELWGGLRILIKYYSTIQTVVHCIAVHVLVCFIYGCNHISLYAYSCAKKYSTHGKLPPSTASLRPEIRLTPPPTPTPYPYPLLTPHPRASPRHPPRPLRPKLQTRFSQKRKCDQIHRFFPNPLKSKPSQSA